MTSRLRSWPLEQKVFGLLLLFSVPVLLINLGQVPFIEDEGIRGLVALEMKLSGNYIAPTLNGEWYLKKPPLWNWILCLSFAVFGEVNEFSARLPTVVFLYIFVIHTFLIFRRHCSTRVAAFSALAVLTCGRILFWDSMLALIDICFSWIIFCLFVWIFECHKEGKFRKLYLGAYLLAALAFLLKGLPALVFLGLTLVVYQWFKNSWTKLFSWDHLLGVLSLVAVLGGYLLAYAQVNSIESLLGVFFDESAKRTIAQHSFSESIREWMWFPFEMLYHFLPWSLLAFLALDRSALASVKRHSFMVFCLIVFAANIWIYWFSPEVYPRYLIMFTPLYFGLGFQFYENLAPDSKSVVDGIMKLLAILSIPVMLAPVFYEGSEGIPNLFIKVLLLTVLLCTLTWLLITNKRIRVLIFFAVLLTLRWGLDLFVLPLRATTTEGSLVREDALRIGRKFSDASLYIFADDSLRFENSFYITSQRKEILTRTYSESPGSTLIVNPRKYPELVRKYPVVDSMHVRRIERIAYILQIPEQNQ